MDILGVILTVLGGVIAIISAVGKLTAQDPVVEMLDSVGVTGGLRQALPLLQIAGGLGVLLSLIAVPLIGVIALACLTLYFLGAVGFHVRAGQGMGDFGVPLGLAVFYAVATVVRGMTI